MCPAMSFVATALFQHPGSELLSAWVQTTALNFPMALCWQIFFAGPLVRLVFRTLFRSQLSGSADARRAEEAVEVEGEAA